MMMVMMMIPLILQLLLPSSILALTDDGSLLLSFKYSILEDPLSVLGDWDYQDSDPCDWNGIACAAGFSSPNPRVIGVLLRNSRLLGSLSGDLFLLEHLRHVDVSGNSLSGALPAALSTAPELQVLSLSDNRFSGEVPGFSSNAGNLRVLDLSHNYLYGRIPAGVFNQLELLDLSSNLLNGSLGEDFVGGENLGLVNFSRNQISGEVPRRFGSRIPANATVDLSFNNLTGEIPDTGALSSQSPRSFLGNPGLCGPPLDNPCSIPSVESPPAIAVVPENPDTGSPPGEAVTKRGEKRGLGSKALAAIVVGDVAAVGLILLLFLYLYFARRKKNTQQNLEERGINGIGIGSSKAKERAEAVSGSGLEKEKHGGAFACCSKNKCGCGEGEQLTSEASETDEDRKAEAKLVMVDEETVLEVETLLRASAYILGGASGSTVVYKAVLEDGTSLAVRRMGERSGTEGIKDFEPQVRRIAKLRHPNLLRVRGFYWGEDEKLLISDFAPNGSISNITFNGKHRSSPFHLAWPMRLRIAKGVAMGLVFLHEKRCVHGNLKPSNILLNAEMEPWIADFGLDRLVPGNNSARTLGTSARLFGSKISTKLELSPMAGTTPSPASGSSSAAYRAPESLRSLRPSAKWDVFSFGVLLLEVLAGRAVSENEVSEWNAGFAAEERRGRALRMVDPAIRGEILSGGVEALAGCFEVGFGCAATSPQRRPSMKEALRCLDRIH